MSSWGAGRRTTSVLAVLAMAAVLLATAPVEATPARYPSEITTAKATPGPGPGETTIKWKSTGVDIDYWKIQTSLTPPNQGHGNDPTRGWQTATFQVPGGAKARKITLTAAQTAAAGAPVGSGNTLLVKVLGIRKNPKQVRYSKQFAASVMGQPTQVGGAPIRVASYNIRAASKDGPGSHSWDKRGPLVAKNILEVAPDIIGLQEAVPAMLTSEYRTTPGFPVLKDLLPGYKLTREAPMHLRNPNLPMDTRILYNATKYRLVSECDDSVEYGDADSEKTCALELPSSDGVPKFAAYARFEVLAGPSAGRQFWFVTAHPDSGADRATEVVRAKQTKEIAAGMDKLNAGLDLPIIFTADTNSYQAAPFGNDSRVNLLDAGYYDTASAVTLVNTKFNTGNKFVSPQRPSANGFGSRLDVVMTKGLPGADLFKIVLTDGQAGFPSYPSDHNMVYTQLALPAA